jgi:hypothetical protein
MTSPGSIASTRYRTAEGRNDATTIAVAICLSFLIAACGASDPADPADGTSRDGSADSASQGADFTIDVGDSPQSVATDQQGTIYVGTYDGVAVIRPGATSVDHTVAVGDDTTSIAVGGDGDLYVSNNTSSTITVFPPGAATPTQTLAMGMSGYLSTDRSGTVYAGCQNATTFGICSISPVAHSLTRIADAALDAGRVEGIAITESGDIYFASDSVNYLSMIGHGASAVTRTIPLSASANRVVADKSGNIYAQTGDTVSVIMAGASTVDHTVKVPDGPFEALAVDDDGGIFAGAAGSNNWTAPGKVYYFKPGTTKIDHTYTVGARPFWATIDNGGSLYVANLNSNTVSVVSKAK